MTARTVWTCDGCDEEKDIRLDGRTGDWKEVSLTFEGFAGYPTCASAPMVVYRRHLCPSCAKQYWERADPANWPRVASTPDDSPIEQ